MLDIFSQLTDKKKLISAITSFKLYKNRNFFSLYTLRKIMKNNNEFRKLSIKIKE